jgi:hypothetical protein
MRSAADIEEVGCPDAAAELDRMESTLSCCPSSRHSLWSFISPVRFRKFLADGWALDDTPPIRRCSPGDQARIG